MSVNDEINTLIPLLVQGKLSPQDAERVEAAIAASPELATERAFWQGIHSIRRDLPKYEFSGHPTSELLDRFARGRLNQLSAEFSEITTHLQQCPACTEDVELLRQAVKYIPEERFEPNPSAAPAKIWSIFSAKTISRIIVPIAAVLVLVFASVVIFNRPGGDIARIELLPQFEKRSVFDAGNLPEMQVSLKKSTRELVFTFPTDRVDVPDYHYDIDLLRRGGEAATLALDNQPLECTPTELTNQCELKVTDPKVLDALKQGGSFSLSIKEEFPEGTNLLPAEYEFYFKVTVQD